MNEKQKLKKMFAGADKSHRVWHKFSDYLVRAFGKDLHGEWQYMKVGKKTIRHRTFNSGKLAERLVGYEVMYKIEKWISRYAPEIKIISCDDAVYAGSRILLIPHPKHGITLMYIPQCTSIQNQLFLYEDHFNNLVGDLVKMAKIAYPKTKRK